MNKQLFLTVGLLMLAGCGQVKPGHVGIKVNQYGSNAGVSNQALGVGTYFTPYGTNIYEYPVFTNTYTYTKSIVEGSENNEEFNFQDKSGLGLTADIAVSYSVSTVLAPKLFQKYRTDAGGIIAGSFAQRHPECPRQPVRVDGCGGDLRAAKSRSCSTGSKMTSPPILRRLDSTWRSLFWAGNVRVPRCRPDPDQQQDRQ